MDILLSKITQQAMNYAIRSGVTITSGYAIRQCSRLLKTVKGSEREEIASLQLRLESKIRIISPAIDMIELIAARGNTSLESAVTLTKQIRLDIQDLGVRLSRAATDEELLRKGSSRAKSREQTDLELQLIIADMKRLLSRIEDAVPLISLAITTSGVSLSTSLPSTVSPSRLLQASTFLTAGDSNYVASLGRGVQVGPAFVLSVYMLFAAHAYRPHDDEGVREATWQEVIHKARVKLLRVPLDKLYDLPHFQQDHAEIYSNGAETPGDNYSPADVPSEGKAYEFAYQLLIVEDFDDDRVHEDEEQEPFDDVQRAGIREIIPIHEVSKLFYADTGKILNIGSDGEANNPILLLKRDTNAVPPRRMVERQTVDPDDDIYPSTEPNEPTPIKVEEDEDGPDAQLRRESSVAPDTPRQEPEQPGSKKWRFPLNLDPEWIAFEVYNEAPDSDEEDVDPSLEETSSPPPSRRAFDPLASAFSHLRLHRSQSTPASMPPPHSTPQSSEFKSSQLVHAPPADSPAPILMSNIPALPALRTSLSLLELLIRLTALQQFQQSSHLSINDELLNFFLSESSTTGAGADTEYRKKMRRDARRRVGFDPYDESPVKRRGEQYLDQYGEHGQDQWDTGDYEYEEDYGSGDWRYGAAGAAQSPQESPGLRSPRFPSPSPSLRRGVQGQAIGAGPMRQPAFGPPITPQGVAKGRPEAIRRETEHRRSPLGRVESDSALGTSPRSAPSGPK